jgi:hypothetical protein
MNAFAEGETLSALEEDKPKAMTTDTFDASVQCGDWRGTSAADDADGNHDLHAFLIAKDLYNPATEFVLATHMHLAENPGGKVQDPYIEAFIVEKADFETVATWLNEQADPIPVKRVEVGLSIEEFIGCFTRLSVVLLKRGLDLEGREYQYED